MKVTFSQKKLLESWFHKIFFRWEWIFVFPHCKQPAFSSIKNSICVSSMFLLHLLWAILSMSPIRTSKVFLTQCGNLNILREINFWLMLGLKTHYFDSFWHLQFTCKIWVATKFLNFHTVSNLLQSINFRFKCFHEKIALILVRTELKID